MANEDVRYRQSTQYKLWSFSPAKLFELREQTNSLATSQISSRLTRSQPEQNAPAVPEFLTAAEEAQLLKHYTVELLRAAVFCELPTEVRATAAVFLRRFYITNSVMTYPPTDLLKTCLFFGSKAEGYYTRLAKLAEKFPNTSEEEILAGEFLLCQGIRFAFDVRHPFRALEGAILELRRHENLQIARVEAAHSRAREILKFSSLVTDAYFHYTPSQIMLAALSLADRGLAEALLQDTFEKSHKAEQRLMDSGGNTMEANAKSQTHNIRDKAMGAIESCRDMLATEPPERMRDFWETTESNKLIRPLLKKLKKCRDPDRADLVALQKARREAAVSKEARVAVSSDGAIFGADGSTNSGSEMRGAKRRRVAATDDVFGPELG